MTGPSGRSGLRSCRSSTPGAVPRTLGALSAVIVASAGSQQTQTCAARLRAFAGIASRLRTDGDRAAFDRCLGSVLPSVIQHAEAPPLSDALEHLQDTLESDGYRADRVAEVRDLLSAATRQLLPKASDEPDSARPQAGWTSGAGRAACSPSTTPPNTRSRVSHITTAARPTRLSAVPKPHHRHDRREAGEVGHHPDAEDQDQPRRRRWSRRTSRPCWSP